MDAADGAYRALAGAAERVLAAGDGGTLVARATSGAAGDRARFAFDAAEGCATFPEVEVNVTGAPSRARPRYSEVRGSSTRTCT